MLKKTGSILISLSLPILTLSIILLMLFLYLPSQASGTAVFVVNSTLDNIDGDCNVAHCSLREAILAANNTSVTDTITFSLPPSATITLNGTTLPTIIEPLTIDGSTAVNLTISANDDSRIFIIGSLPPGYLAPGEEIEQTEVGSGTAVTLTDLILTNGYSGNGSVIFNDGRLLIENSRITNSKGQAGAIFNHDLLTITNSTLNNNLSFNQGGAIFNNNVGKMNIYSSNIISNSAANEGGAILNNQGQLNIYNTIFANNLSTANRSGGAIYSNGNLTVTNSTFHNNSGWYGGAIYSRDRLNIWNSTFSQNEASAAGGALTLRGFNEATVFNSTFNENTADDIGGGIYIDTDLVFANNIIANSISASDCYNSGSIISNSNNLIKDGSCNPDFTDDPLLGPLQDNGGDTWTFALMDGSPAVDNGNPATCAAPPINNLDQRGQIRPIDGDGNGSIICDIGAYEASTASIGLFKTGPAVAFAGDPITYNLTVGNNLTQTLSNVVLTDTLPAGATYISGGTLVGDVISWTIPSLNAGTTITEQFVVTATQTITNNDYQVTADSGYMTEGGTAVVTYVGQPITTLTASNDGPHNLGELTAFTASIATGTDVIYNWNYGDGDVGAGQTPQHLYLDPGVFTAVVTATNPYGSVTATTDVTINDVPVSGLSAGNNSPTILGNSTFLFSSISAGTNVVFTWDFGDGTFGTGQTRNHTYPDAGTYFATVTATNSTNFLTKVTVVTINDVPISGLSASNNSPTPVGSPTSLMASTTAGTNVAFAWSFGDGSSGSGPNPVHTYPAMGVFTAVVTASNSSGTAVASTTVTVESSDPSIYLPAVLKANGPTQPTAAPPSTFETLAAWLQSRAAIIPDMLALIINHSI